MLKTLSGSSLTLTYRSLFWAFLLIRLLWYTFSTHSLFWSWHIIGEGIKGERTEMTCSRVHIKKRVIPVTTPRFIFLSTALWSFTPWRSPYAIHYQLSLSSPIVPRMLCTFILASLTDHLHPFLESSTNEPLFSMIFSPSFQASRTSGQADHVSLPHHISSRPSQSRMSSSNSALSTASYLRPSFCPSFPQLWWERPCSLPGLTHSHTHAPTLDFLPLH